MAINTAFVVVLLMFLALGMEENRTSPESLGLSFIMVVVTVPFYLCLPLVSIYIQCCRLSNYSEHVKYLEKKIQELSAPTP